MDICSRKSHYFGVVALESCTQLLLLLWQHMYWTGSIGIFPKLQRLIWVGVNGCCCQCCSTFPLREDNAIWPSRVPKKFCCLLTCNWLWYVLVFYDEDWRKQLLRYTSMLIQHRRSQRRKERDREPYHQNGNEKNKVPNCSRACVLFVISLLTNAAATVLYHMIVVLLPSRPLLTISAICKCAFWKGSFLAFWTIT